MYVTVVRDEAIAGLCVVIQRIVRSYQVSRDPCNLDLLIYQVSKLLGILIAVTYCSDQVLDAVGQIMVGSTASAKSRNFAHE